jgi:hypothetical protein
MYKFYSLILAATITFLTLPVFAEELSYTFISADYSIISTKLDGFTDDFEGNGIVIDLSLAVRPHMAVIGSYMKGSADLNFSGSRADADIDSTSLGILLHVPINKYSDFILSVSFFNGKAVINIDGTSFRSEDANGGVTTLGFRSRTSDLLEFYGFIRRIKIEESSHIGINVGLAYYLAESVTMDLAFSVDDDTDSIALGLTKYF